MPLGALSPPMLKRLTRIFHVPFVASHLEGCQVWQPSKVNLSLASLQLARMLADYNDKTTTMPVSLMLW